MKKYEYIQDASTGIEVVSMENVSTSFPPHTHTGHYVFGIVTEGCIAIKIGEEVKQCRDGEYFSIAPDTGFNITGIKLENSFNDCVAKADDIISDCDDYLFFFCLTV